MNAPLIFKQMSGCIKIKLIFVQNHMLPNSLIKNPLLSDKLWAPGAGSSQRTVAVDLP